MSVQVKLRKGGNIKLKGVASRVVQTIPQSEIYAIKPTDFHGVVPKLIAKEGATVKVGSPLFFDKENESIIWTSPVSGQVVEIVRGARRKVLEIRIKSDGQFNAEHFSALNPDEASREDLINLLLKAGLWPMVKQRPFDVIANPAETPKAIFVSAFDTAPLAPDYDFVLEERAEEFHRGIEVLAKLSKNGLVNLNVPVQKEVKFNTDDQFSYTDATGKIHTVDFKVANNAPESNPAKQAIKAIENKYSTPSAVFMNADRVSLGKIDGPHPAGNVGVQIHHINPINKGDVVWTVNAQDVAIIGKLVSTGVLSFEKIIALAGSEVKTAQYYKVVTGSPVLPLIEGNLAEAEEEPRIISGNVLTGSKIEKDGFIGFYDNLVSVIPEGNKFDLFGWAVPVQPNKFSFSKTLMSWLTPNKEYRLNTNTNGEPRAFVVTGQYEKFLPMNVYPVQLLKACLFEDIDQMEGLGIYEVAPEDLALCEFSCTSKTPVQRILRDALDLVKKECA